MKVKVINTQYLETSHEREAAIQVWLDEVWLDDNKEVSIEHVAVIPDPSGQSYRFGDDVVIFYRD
jgi:hypothetical protein